MYLWVSFIPLVVSTQYIILFIFIKILLYILNIYIYIHFINGMQIVLSLGTKLEVIVARMALQLQDKTTVIKGAPLVQPNDNLFWFSHPKHVLTLLHFTLFMVSKFIIINSS